IYSLGCTLYYLLTGQPPFPGATLAEKLVKHQQAEPPALQRYRRDVPAELVTILRKMLAKRPADRYQTPAEVAGALAHLLRGAGAPRSTTPAAASPFRSFGMKLRKLRGFKWIAASLLLTLVVALLWLGLRPKSQLVPDIESLASRLNDPKQPPEP